MGVKEEGWFTSNTSNSALSNKRPSAIMLVAPGA